MANDVFVVLRSILLASVVLLLLLLILHAVRRKYYQWRMNLPGKHPNWWNPFGVELRVWMLMRKKNFRGGAAVFEYIVDLCEEFKQHVIFNAWIAHVPILVISKADSAEFVLSSTAIIEKSSFYDLLHNWLGTGLLTSGRAKWRSRRKLLTPAFHFRILEDFLDVFNEQAIVLSDIFKRRSKLEKTFDITENITSCTLDIICETAMGCRIAAQTEPKSDYVEALYTVGESFIDRMFEPWHWFDWAFRLSAKGRHLNRCLKIMHDFSMKVIKERRQLMQTASEPVQSVANDIGYKVRTPFLHLLLETHLKEGTLSLEDIQEEVDTFMFEGHDTTAMGLCWTLFLLAENPEAQRKVQAELIDVFGEDQTRHVTTDDLSRLKYLECCIKESQRLFPSVPYIGRKFHEDSEYKKNFIPAGTQAFVIIYKLHRDPEVFPDPEKFDPDRFLPENCHGRHPFAYVPFSAGPRNCIGQKFALMEEKVILCWVLRKLRLKASIRREDLRIVGELVTRSVNGFPMSMEAI